MNRNWRDFNNFHLKGREDKYLGQHVKLVAYVQDHPSLTYEQYKKKAQSLGIDFMSEEGMKAKGFCIETPAPEYHVQFNKARDLESTLFNIVHNRGNVGQNIEAMHKLLDEYEMVVTAVPVSTKGESKALHCTGFEG